MLLQKWQAIAGLLNAMVKGVILILPIFALDSGWMQTIIIISISGLTSFYSCYIYITHLDNNSDLDKAIFYHFWKSKFMTIFYNFVVFLNLLLILVSYFMLIVQQWNNLLTNNVAIPICNAIFLIFLILILRYFNFGLHLMSYGLVSVLLYGIFLLWVLVTAPSGDQKMPIFTSQFPKTAAAIAQGYSIQQFFIPILKELRVTQTKNFTIITFVVFIFGSMIYLFICLVGSFGIFCHYIGILNRAPFEVPKSIESFFQKGQWQVMGIQVIYLIHLYTSYGWFTFIAKKRLFCILNLQWGIKNSKTSQFYTPAQIVFAVICVFFSLGLYLSGIPTQTVIVINGGVVGFFFIYLIPGLLHLKCWFLPRPKKIYQNIKKQRHIKFEKNEVRNDNNSKIRELSQTKQENIDFSFSLRESLPKNLFSQQNGRSLCRKSICLQGLDVGSSKINGLGESEISQKNWRQLKVFQKIGYENELELRGVDVSAALSLRERNQNIISYRCQTEVPEMRRKILELVLVLSMLSFGVFTMVVSIISIKNKQ